ncbi:MAG: hypothetical protein POG74_09265 [Acidocella sp.]|nr:hypothetical protein [Acidocella sp.]
MDLVEMLGIGWAVFNIKQLGGRTSMATIWAGEVVMSVYGPGNFDMLGNTYFAGRFRQSTKLPMTANFIPILGLAHKCFAFKLERSWIKTGMHTGVRRVKVLPDRKKAGAKTPASFVTAMEKL